MVVSLTYFIPEGVIEVPRISIFHVPGTEEERLWVQGCRDRWLQVDLFCKPSKTHKRNLLQ